ncbi:anti-sigma factor antagonist [Flammeovirga kamogawensis]|uniref:Anti-sigma factor antagonist n=1 Tax=Flammeovirga kamogawensis TaxID=373891 RepID=A0ABX8H547_9BACT|nr:anti-sigma factor antagonist [Flammeovirga kamogawensis]MBB6461834.1 anti-sigma B factor antagonist [Flammeovirga kamogawensis]QWG10551.1 anti-sigma factor antagonist [Flammeovirga kamogawensis]TRX63659.1 anti-sigma factor antagonist [Flammeovirga kamogawensis]
MEYKIENIDGITVINVIGFLDANTSASLDEKINTLITKEGHSKVILNLKDVTYMSSSGLRIFLSASKEVQKVNGKFVVCNANDTIKDIVKMSGFDMIVDLKDTLEESLESIK